MRAHNDAGGERLVDAGQRGAAGALPDRPFGQREFLGLQCAQPAYDVLRGFEARAPQALGSYAQRGERVAFQERLTRIVSTRVDECSTISARLKPVS